MIFLLTEWKDTYGRDPRMDRSKKIKKNVRISDIKSRESLYESE